MALCLVAALTVSAGAAGAQDAHLDLLSRDFQDRLDQIVQEADGILGVQVVDLTSGETFGRNADLVFPQGSAIKVPVLLTLLAQDGRGETSASERIPIRAENREGGSGLIQHFADEGSEMSLHDLAVAMIVVSDNMATNLLVDRLSLEAINGFLDEAGLPRTRMRRRMMRTEQSARGNENVSTPAEAADLMGRLATCRLPLERGGCEEALRILRINHPHASPFQDAGPGVAVAEKNGWFTGVRTTWAYVELPGRPFAAAVMGTYSDSDAVLESARKVAEESFRYFRRLAGATPYGTRVPLELLDSVAPPPEG